MGLAGTQLCPAMTRTVPTCSRSRSVGLVGCSARHPADHRRQSGQSGFNPGQAFLAGDFSEALPAASLLAPASADASRSAPSCNAISVSPHTQCLQLGCSRAAEPAPAPVAASAGPLSFLVQKRKARRARLHRSLGLGRKVDERNRRGDLCPASRGAEQKNAAGNREAAAALLWLTPRWRLRRWPAA